MPIALATYPSFPPLLQRSYATVWCSTTVGDGFLVTVILLTSCLYILIEKGQNCHRRIPDDRHDEDIALWMSFADINFLPIVLKSAEFHLAMTMRCARKFVIFLIVLVFVNQIEGRGLSND